MSAVVANPYSGLSYNDKKRWICVYPAYINSRKTVTQGRRIARSCAVDNPLCTEIRDVCVSQQLNAELENNHYPREQAKDHIHSGRVKVQLRRGDGSYLNQEITTRKQLLQKLGLMIPQLKSRQAGKGVGNEGLQSSSNTTKKRNRKRK